MLVYLAQFSSYDHGIDNRWTKDDERRLQASHIWRLTLYGHIKTAEQWTAIR